MKLIQATLLALLCLVGFSSRSVAMDLSPGGFAINFDGNTHSTYSLESGVPIQLVAEGTLPRGWPVIISAWHKGRLELITSFTSVLRAEPWIIPASRMDQLPEGEVVITIEPLGGKKVSKVFNIVVPVFTLAFAADTPATLTLGQMPTINLVPRGKPNQPQIVIVSAWDKTKSQVVTAFTMVLKGEPWTIPASQMSKLPEGQIVVTVEPLAAGDKVSKLFTVVKTPPVEPEDPIDPVDPVDPVDPDEDIEKPTIPEPPTEIGKGFTDYKTGPDSKVIYVPSGGSIQSGYDQLRNGYPDHLVLEAGGTYNIGSGIKWGKSGRSKDEPMVFGVVGDGDRPVIHCSGSAITFSATVRYTAFVGLHLTADTRNPNHASYKSDCPRYDGFSLYQPAHDLTIEDCLIEYFTHGVMLEGANDSNVHLHRTIIRRSWSQSSKGHSQGLYGLRVNGLTITDCLFDHNGWEPNASGGGRTIFNHNIYVIGTKGLLIDNSIFTRGSSYGLNLRTGSQSGQDQVDVTIRNSLFLDNANTIAAGGKVKEIVSKNLNISDCVFTRHGSVLNGAAQSLGINGFCWDGIDISRNYFIDKSFGGTSFAVKFEPGKGPVRNGKINDNVVHNWLVSETAIQPNGTNMSATGNYVSQTASLYADGSRTLDTYLQSVGADGGTAGFIEWVSTRPRRVWDPRPYDFVAYIQDGFKPMF